MKYYVVSDSIDVHKINAKNLNKALFANSEFYGFKTLEDAQRLANDELVYPVYEVDVQGKKGIKAQDCKLDNGEVIKGAVIINRKQVNKFTAVRAHIGDQTVALGKIQETPVVSEEEVAPKAKAKTKNAAKGKAKSKAKAEEVVIKEEPKEEAKAAPKAKRKGKTKVKAKDVKATVIDLDVIEDESEKKAEVQQQPKHLFSNQLAAAIAIPAATALLFVKGFVAPTLTGLATAVAATAGLFTLVLGAAYAAKYLRAKYDRYNMTQQQRQEVDFAADKDQLQKLEETLANKTDADTAFIMHMHDLEEAAPLPKFNDDGSEAAEKPSFTKAQVVQFEMYAMRKLNAAKTEDRAKTEAELVEEADKKFTVKA
ncbi:MAG: hypothetical protein JSR17_11440 [Proteobacteria bacterium]|nr:hypothetical protein [Pseudomonadota bacterium]